MHQSHTDVLFAGCHLEFPIQYVLGWGLGICISYKFPSDVDAAGPETII